MNISSLEELEQLLKDLYKEIGNAAFVVEEQFDGNEYRIFYTQQGEYAILQREPAYVIGDGKHTINFLADQETYARAHPRTNCLCPILIDDLFLKKMNMTADTIPAKGEKIYVRSNSNVAK
jgi:D-alanine-D-alanine ligase-like ATP-grasp enzyme